MATSKTYPSGSARNFNGLLAASLLPLAAIEILAYKHPYLLESIAHRGILIVLFFAAIITYGLGAERLFWIGLDEDSDRQEAIFLSIQRRFHMLMRAITAASILYAGYMLAQVL